MHAENAEEKEMMRFIKHSFYCMYSDFDILYVLAKNMSLPNHVHLSLYIQFKSWMQ